MSERIWEGAPSSVPGERTEKPAPRSPFAQADQTAEELRNEAAEKVQQAGQRARQGIDEGKHRVAERLRSVSSSLRQASEQFPEEERSVTRYVDKAGDGIDRVARYIDATSIDTAVRDMEQFAKRSPAVFYGSAFAIGLAAARFLKSRASGGRAPAIQAPEIQMPRGTEPWP